MLQIGNLDGELRIHRYKKAIKQDNRVIARKSPRPATPPLVLQSPNRYDKNRCHLAVFNWDQRAAVRIQPLPTLQPGDCFRILDPRDFYGKPLLTGKFDGKAIEVPVKGEFAALVLVKEASK